MNKEIIISDKELEKFSAADTLSNKMLALLIQQKANWTTCKEGYQSLEDIKIKKFLFDGFEVKIQFNPGRIKSTSAKVDAKSIEERKCFLCSDNLPDGQRAIPYYKDYLILCNPYPIFPEHFTITKYEHLPQQIINRFDSLLNLSKEIGENFVLFYNGPKCGASAPDHLHFQAGNKNYMPIDNEFDNIKNLHGEKLADKEELKIYAVDKYLRKFISFESNNIKRLETAFNYLVTILQKAVNDKNEPMMNILSYYKNDQWRIIIFPRAKHRPTFYYLEDERKILLSPASVDLGGVCITPRKEDFEKITKANIVEIYRQVSLSTEFFEFLKKELKKIFVIR